MTSIKCRLCQQFKDETDFDVDKSGTRYEACKECRKALENEEVVYKPLAEEP